MMKRDLEGADCEGDVKENLRGGRVPELVLGDDNLSLKMRKKWRRKNRRRMKKWRRKKIMRKRKRKLPVPVDEVVVTVHEEIPEDELEGEAVFEADGARDIIDILLMYSF